MNACAACAHPVEADLSPAGTFTTWAGQEVPAMRFCLDDLACLGRHAAQR